MSVAVAMKTAADLQLNPEICMIEASLVSVPPRTMSGLVQPL